MEVILLVTDTTIPPRTVTARGMLSFFFACYNYTLLMVRIVLFAHIVGYSSSSSSSYGGSSSGYGGSSSSSYGGGSSSYGGSSYSSGGRGGYGGSSGGGYGGSSGGYGGKSDRMPNMGSGLTRINWDLNQLPKFEKNFYKEHPSVERLSDQDVADFRAKNSITVQGRDIPRPIRTFEEASFPGKLTVHC